MQLTPNVQRPSERKDIIDYAPHFCSAIGLLLILLAAYIAGGDELTCARKSSQVDCQLVNRRLLNRMVRSRQEMPDVIGLFVRTTSSPTGDRPFDPSTKMTVNQTLVLRTRQGADVPTIAAGDSALQLEALMHSTDSKQITVLNSYWPVSATCFGLGAVLALFGGIAIVKG